jgi:K+-transporting ATPase A subunit
MVATLVLVSQGVIQNLSAYLEVTTLDGTKQLLAMGPVASQEVIKLLGTNGGGFFNANSAHPFENPTALTNLISMVLIFAIPAALTYTYGRMAASQKQGWVLFGAMAVLFLAGVSALYAAESHGNPALSMLGIDQSAGNLEGKEAALRGLWLRTVCNRHHRRFLRCCQCDARELHATWRPGTHGQHPAWRGHFWRSRSRSVWDADLCTPCGIHRRS